MKIGLRTILASVLMAILALVGCKNKNPAALPVISLNTYTATATGTATMSGTITPTFSVTMTFSVTETHTVSPTLTVTPTITNTPIVWKPVGYAAISPGRANYTSMDLYGGFPYIAFSDNSVSGKASLMRYDGSSWEYVGGAGFSSGEAQWVELDVDDVTGVPCVAFRDDSTIDWKLTVMRYINNAWETVGTPRFSAGRVEHMSIKSINNIIYISYVDAGYGYSVCIRVYSGGSWYLVGPTYLAATTNSFYTSLQI
ncbi:MAG TPA: hypothetical protein P5511_10380, partial [Candidatus Goldiibacteriota bacterium]|nr:hypothetical protein [Candidatus Goldiibacteriota bacterium]